MGLNIEKCVSQSQSYDNKNNMMTRKCTGLQARIKELALNTAFLLSVAHFLNLVGVRAVESCNNRIENFNII